MIEIKNLCKNYDGVTVVDDLNLKINKGEVLGSSDQMVLASQQL